LLLAACVSIPTGPSVASFPGSGKSFDQFRGDDSECRQYATDSVGGSNPTEVQADSAVKSAAVGTAIGALAGAALGGRGGAGAGAGAGLLFGALVGSESANTSGYVVQRRYDNAYLQCMYAKGHQVPASGPIRSAVPMYNAPGVSPTYYYPPPPPPPSPPAG
jgi:hypothetical protein